MCIFGVYIIKHKRHLKTVDGTVTTSSYDCSTQTRDKSTTETCKFDVTYRVDQKDYTDTFSSTNKLSSGETITIWYDPNHPEKGEINHISKTIGIVFIVLSIIVIVSVWVSVWLTKRYKFAAAGMGTAAVVGMI